MLRSDGLENMLRRPCPLPRDIYYIDPQYFRSQRTVDGIIDDLAYTVGVDRAALNVVRFLIHLELMPQ